MGIIAFIIAVLCLFKWKQAKYDKENFDANSSKYKSLNKRSKILLIISILAFIFSIGSCISNGSKTSDTKKYVQTEENMSDDERRFKEKQDKEQEEARKAVEKARAEQSIAQQIEETHKKESFQKAADAAVHEALESGEIISVNYKDSILTINLDETQIKNDGFNTPQIDILATRVTAVGDKVVDIPGFDEAVERVVVKFRCGKMIEMPTSIIKTNEYNMRYFPNAYIYDNLK